MSNASQDRFETQRRTEMTSLARLVEQFDPGEPFETPAYWLQGERYLTGYLRRYRCKQSCTEVQGGCRPSSPLRLLL